MVLPAGISCFLLVAGLPLSERLLFDVKRADRLADLCPTDDAIRTGIEERLGGGVFLDAPADATTLVVELAAEPAGYVGGVSFVDAEGRVRGARRVQPQADCVALVDRISLAAAIAIDPLGRADDIALPPLSAGEQPVNAAAVELFQDEQSPSTPPAPARAAIVTADPRATQLRLGAGLGAAVGVWPGATFFGRLFAGVVVDQVELDVHLQYEPTAPQLLARDVGADVTRTAFVVSPCLRVVAAATVLLCGAAEAALAGVTARLPLAAPVAAPQLSAGPRVALELPLSPALGLRMEAQALATVLRPRLRDTVTADVLYDVGQAQAAFGLGLVFTP